VAVVEPPRREIGPQSHVARGVTRPDSRAGDPQIRLRWAP